MSDQQRALNYMNYLAVDELLTLQRPVSEGPEHDELLFITIHQVYELWFKQLLHELEQAQRQMAEVRTQDVLATLNGVKTILAVCIRQVGVLVTMTLLHFSTFHIRLESARRFPSAVLEVYRSGHQAGLVLEQLVDIEVSLREWRFRHVMMVERTIGIQQGTGGSSGVGYLSSTLQHPHSFPELWQVREDF